jgi:hypothetical protein
MAKRKTSEHDALKGIDNLLEDLEPNEKQRVFDFIISKHKVVLPTSVARSGKQKNPLNMILPLLIKQPAHSTIVARQAFYPE